MKPIFKKYYSLFLLGLFLFAYTEKNVHAMLHADDEHCMAQNEKHFHNQEHHCFICDFNISFPYSSSFVASSSFQQYACNASFIITESGLNNSFSSFHTNRGPPVIS